ncbi:hypothetical protein E4U13_008204, partial [Claviceps humidiphila]
TDDDDDLSDESASLYTSDELYLDDASDNVKKFHLKGRRASHLERAGGSSVSERIPDVQRFASARHIPGDMLHGSTSTTGDEFPQFHLDMRSLFGLPLRSVILEGSSSANGDNGLDLALCESITRLEKWMTKYGIEG